MKRFVKQKIFGAVARDNAVVGSASGDLVSNPVEISRVDNVAIQISWAGSTVPVGAFSVEVSLDYVPSGTGSQEIASAGNWTALDIGDAPAPSGNTGSILIRLNQLAEPWLRVKYTYTSGTGLFTGFVAAKEI
jgi:hypothetical protein